MKIRWSVALFALAVLMAPATASWAHEYAREDSDHPLRYIAYAVHPFGIAVEYALLRPIHWMVSKPDLDIIFGHEPQPTERPEDYFAWE